MYYAVMSGVYPGLYLDKDLAEEQVKGNEKFYVKEFDDKTSAVKFLKTHAKFFVSINPLVDRVYNNKKGTSEKIKKMTGIDYEPTLVEFDNAYDARLFLNNEIDKRNDLFSHDSSFKGFDEEGLNTHRLMLKTFEPNVYSIAFSKAVQRSYSRSYIKYLKKQTLQPGEFIVYIDGSYNEDTDKESFGVTLINDGDIKMYSGETFDVYKGEHNVGAELSAFEFAAKTLISLDAKKATMYYDFNGFRNYLRDGYFPTRGCINKYVQIHKYVSNKLELEMIHVKGHKGNPGNTLTDKVAFYKINSYFKDK